MSYITNKNNEWNHIVDADTVEGSFERVMIEEIMETFKDMKIGKVMRSI